MIFDMIQKAIDRIVAEESRRDPEFVKHIVEGEQRVARGPERIHINGVEAMTDNILGEAPEPGEEGMV